MKSMFAIQGNICGSRIRLGRAMHKPPLTQRELAKEINFLGLTNMTGDIIAKIERGERHVIDAELYRIAQVLGVTMEWLVTDNE